MIRATALLFLLSAAILFAYQPLTPISLNKRNTLSAQENPEDYSLYLIGETEPLTDRIRSLEPAETLETKGAYLLLCVMRSAHDKRTLSETRLGFSANGILLLYGERELYFLFRLLRIGNTYIHLIWAALVACLIARIFGLVRRVRRYRRLIGRLTAHYDLLKKRYLKLSHDFETLTAEDSFLLDAFERMLVRFRNLLDKGYKATNERNLVRELKEYAKKIRKDPLTFSDIRFVVNKRYFGLVDFLRTLHPDLTEYETDMLCMIRTDFSFNSVRLLHQHDSVYSLYSRRTKIHRKLGLAAGYRIEDYLFDLTGKLKARISM